MKHKTTTTEAVARKLVELRTKADLTQRELAKLVGTSASVICRLEDADYEGHSLATLQSDRSRTAPARRNPLHAAATRKAS